MNEELHALSSGIWCVTEDGWAPSSSPSICWDCLLLPSSWARWRTASAAGRSSFLPECFSLLSLSAAVSWITTPFTQHCVSWSPSVRPVPTWLDLCSVGRAAVMRSWHGIIYKWYFIFSFCFIRSGLKWIALELIPDRYRTMAGFVYQLVFALGIAAVAGWSYWLRDWPLLQIVFGLHSTFLLLHAWWVNGCEFELLCLCVCFSPSLLESIFQGVMP